MWSFLSNLGSGLKNLGSGFAHGAASVGKGIGRGVKRLGELGEGDYDLGPGGTPGINPNAGYSGQGGVRGIEDAVAAAENDARADYGAKPAPLLDGDMPNLPDLPINRRDLPIPAPTPAPSLAEMRSPLPSLPPARRVTPVAAPAAAPVAAGMEALKPEMDMDRRNLPIPRLPGHAGGPTPYNAIDAAKYDYVMGHAKRDAEGNLTHGFNRDWKTTLQNALRGASMAAGSAGPGEDPLGRALGGALTAGAGSAINPQAGYEFAFDAGERPKMEAEQARARAERAAVMEETLNRAKLEGMDAETGLKRSQSNKAQADVEIARQAEERQRLEAESRRRWNDARTLAELTGVQRVEDIYNPQTGVFERVAFYPGGKTQVIGRSAKAEIDLRNIQSRKEIARQHEAGEYGRESMRQAGQDRRQQNKIDADKEAAGDAGGSKLRKPSSGRSSGGQGGKSATMDQLRAFYKDRGVTDDTEIRKRAAKFGVTVKD